MKKFKLSCMLFLLILSIFAGVGVELTRAEIVVTTDENNSISTPVQRKTFIWDNRAYVFYHNGSYMCYKHRSNLTSWSSEIGISTCTSGHRFSVWLEEDGSNGYVHYVVSDRTEYVYYRKGKLLPSGVISWVATEQAVLISEQPYTFYSEDVAIAVDSEGYPIVMVCTEWQGSGGWQTQVFINANKDGTWSTIEEKGIEHPTDGRFPGLQIVPQTNRMFWVWASDVVDGIGWAKVYHWDGSSWTGPTGYGESCSSLNSWPQYNMLCESGSNVTLAFYNKDSAGDSYLELSVWDGEDWSWYTEHAKFPLADSTNVVASLDTSNNHVRVTWLEYPDANKIYYMTWNGTEFTNWNGTAWEDASVWITETEDIIDHSNFNSIYSSDTYYAIAYITNATSKNVEFLVEPYLEPPPPQQYYDVEIYIRINGYEPYTNVTFTIDTTTYSNGQTANLFSDVYGDYHNLTGTSIAHLSFINWTVTGDLTVSSASDPAAHLFVSGTGTLTEHLNATVAITHNATTVTNFNADDWLFAEHKYYDFQSTYVLTNSYIDTAVWSFIDHSSNNVTFYFKNSTEEGVLSATKPFALTGGNATYSYTWINLTDQYFTVTISLWLKYKIIDTMYVDLYVKGNCSGYGMTNSTGAWVLAQESYFNIYSQGGAEEMTTSGQAGRLTGGDYFNLYAYNNSYAKSEIYWRNLVHVKILLELGWDHGSPPDEYPNPEWRFGFDYYAGGSWVKGFQFYCHLDDFAYGADWQYAHFSAAILEGSAPDLIWSGDLYTFFDVDRGGSKIWLDLWFNKVNASSVWGVRLTSFYYGVQNNADWVKRIFTGNVWGVYYANMSEIVIFGELQDTAGTKMFSSEISLVKVWHKLYQGVDDYNGTGSTDNIQQFDYTFSIDMQGIPTPSFEAPKTPNMPMGGFLGVLASWLSALLSALSPAFAMVWTGIVWMLDEAISWVTFGAVTNGFSSFLTLVLATATSVLSFMVTLASGFADFAATIGYTVSWFFTNFFVSIWGILNFLLLTPTFNIFTAFATIVGVSLAWLGGTTYTNAWGQVYDFSYLSTMTIPGTSFSGGIAVFYIMFVCGFFIQIMACLGTMSIEPIAAPIRLFWGVIMFMIQVIEILWNITTGFISLLVQIVEALRNIAPRPLGL